MTLVELSAKSRDLRHEMFNLRLQQAERAVGKPARLTVPAQGHRATRNTHLRVAQQSEKIILYAEEIKNLQRPANAKNASAKSSRTKMTKTNRRPCRTPVTRTRDQKNCYRLTRNFTRTTKRPKRKIGDTVRIEETRPLSKLKRWKFVEVVSARRKETSVAA